MSQSRTAEHTLASRIGRIAAVLAREDFPTGERAALRRMRPGTPLPLVFYRFALRHLPENWERRASDWITIVAGIALMAPNAHRGDRPLGRVLAEAGYAEARLERLLAARADTRQTLLLRLARFLTAKGEAFNWTDAAQLLLTSDQDYEKRERLYRRIARDYFYHTKE